MRSSFERFVHRHRRTDFDAEAVEMGGQEIEERAAAARERSSTREAGDDEHASSDQEIAQSAVCSEAASVARCGAARTRSISVDRQRDLIAEAERQDVAVPEIVDRIGRAPTRRRAAARRCALPGRSDAGVGSNVCHDVAVPHLHPRVRVLAADDEVAGERIELPP